MEGSEGAGKGIDRRRAAMSRTQGDVSWHQQDDHARAHRRDRDWLARGERLASRRRTRRATDGVVPVRSAERVGASIQMQRQRIYHRWHLPRSPWASVACGHREERPTALGDREHASSRGVGVRAGGEPNLRVCAVVLVVSVSAVPWALTCARASGVLLGTRV